MEQYTEKVRKLLSQPELLCQLAEECAELSQAALKLRRVITGENPTPLDRTFARDAVFEEVADVLCVLDALNIDIAFDPIDSIRASKMVRWAHRLEERDGLEHS